jgi:hypothetical protein
MQQRTSRSLESSLFFSFKEEYIYISHLFHACCMTRDQFFDQSNVNGDEYRL